MTRSLATAALVLASFLTQAACAGGSATAPPTTLRWRELESLSEALEEATTSFEAGLADPRAAAGRCADLCRHHARICELAGRICHLAEAVPEAAATCREAEASCARTRERLPAECACR